MAIKLRPYQVECLEIIENSFRSGIKRQLVHLPTAAGKTVIFSALIAGMKRRTIVLANTCELLIQAKNKIHMMVPGLSIGILDAAHKEFDADIVVSSIQSARQPDTLKTLKGLGFSLAIADECHRFAAETPRYILNELGFSKDGCFSGDRLLIGFSATPFRSDGLGLGEVFDKIVYTRTTKQMIEEGYLTHPVGRKIAMDLDLSKIAIERGDYSTASLSKLMNTDPINELVIRSYQEKAHCKKAICFATSIAHSDALAEAFKRSGISGRSIHSGLSMQERKEILERFRKGEIEVLCNPLLLTEGFDEPSIECVIVARPTRLPGLYQQMVGRGLRLYPNKTECVVIDFCDEAHTLCNIGILLGDVEADDVPPREKRLQELKRSLPPTINKKLRSAILEMDLLGESFAWQKDFDGHYFLKGAGNTTLKISASKNDCYNAILSSSKGSEKIATSLSFEYAFAAAEDFAKANRSLFTVSDIGACWRSLPISDRQKSVFRSNGYQLGIDELTRGQASAIISSGVLFSKKTPSKSSN